MGKLTFALNVTLDGCYDHRAGIADDEMHRYWTRLMESTGAMLFGRTTYEMMECYWPQVARDPKAKPSDRNWAKKLDAKKKYVVSKKRSHFPWENSHHVKGNLTRAISAIKKANPRGIMVGSPKLARALEKLGLITEYIIVVHPVIAGHGPYLFSGNESWKMKLVSSKKLKSGVVALRYRK